MLKPVKGIAFIVEEEKEVLTESAKEAGIVAPDQMGLAGTIGKIYAVSNNEGQTFKKGQRVVFSKFNAEQLDIMVDGKRIKDLRAVPTDSILGWM